MTTSLSAGARTAAPASRRSTRALTVVGGAAAAAVLWVLAVPVAGVELAVRMEGRTQSIGLASVVGVSLIAGLLGWALLAVLEAHSQRAAGIWTVVALAVTVLSLAGPLTSAVSAAAGGVLVAMHLLVALVVIPVLRRGFRTR